MPGRTRFDSFDPAVDWFEATAAAIGPGELRRRIAASTAAAVGLLRTRLPAANSMHRADEWLSGYAGSPEAVEFASQMVAAVIAADYFNSRTLTPRPESRTVRSKVWRDYASSRATQALESLPEALLRWAVLQRIPTQWISHDAVFRRMNAVLEGHGLTGARISGNLTPPFAGGADWVRAESATDGALLQTDGVRAAVLCWPERTLAAVIVAKDGKAEAFHPRLGRDGVPVRWEGEGGICGIAFLSNPRAAPPGPLMRFARAAGVGDWMWARVREWRASKVTR